MPSAGHPRTTAQRGARHARRALGVLAAAWLVLASALAVWGPGDYPWRDTWLYLVIIMGSAALVIARARRESADRGAWLALGLAMGVSGLGDAAYATVLAGSDEVPFPSWADALYLSYYPLAAVAVVSWTRRRARHVPGAVWQDAGVLALGTASVLGALFLTPVYETGESEAWAVATAAAYPVGDSILLMLALLGVVLTGRSGSRSLQWICAGLIVAGLADLAYWNLVSSDGYVEGTLLDALWPLGNLAFALAAWLPARLSGAMIAPARSVIAIPALSLVLATATLAMGTQVPIPGATVVMAVATLAGVLGRLTATVRTTRLAMEARKEATTDDLTGLTNRRGFMAAGEEFIAKAPSRGAALIVADLDGFKEVNDSLGHSAGDEVLREVAARVGVATHDEAELVARLGGDEFALIVTPAERGREVALRLKEAIAQPVEIEGVRMALTASVGVACSPDDGQTLSDLFRRADIAMYRAKHEGLDVATFDAALDLAGEERLHRVAQLRDAISAGELVVHYQPQIALASGAVVGLEALVRWVRPDGSVWPPGRFLPLAANAGLMGDVTDAVLARVVAQIAQWRARGLDVRVAVNMPASAFSDDGLADAVTRRLADHGLPADALSLEITEEALMREASGVRAVLADLRVRGISVALDDYGTGYSSLLYLREFLVDEIKIDQSFVVPLLSDHRSRAIVRSTIELAHALDLRVVAEGIESAAVANVLTECGCDMAQGFLWSPALEPAALEEWLRGRTIAARGD